MKPYWTSSDGDIYHGNVLDVLKQLSDGSVQMCVTSPPYWGLRDYGNEPQIWDGEPDCGHVWGHKLPSNPAKLREKRVFGDWKTGGSPEIKFSNAETQGQFCQLCGAWKGSLGLESTPELYISHMVQIFREVKRVLRKDGTLWLNIGDSYAVRGQNRSKEYVEKTGGNTGLNRNNTRTHEFAPIPKGLKPKDLVGIPWMLAFALRADGWWLRSDIIWHKPNPMPESCTDRPTKAHEYMFLLTKSAKYFYDADAIKEKMSPNTHSRGKAGKPAMTMNKLATAGSGIKNNDSFQAAMCDMPHGSRRNKRSVWTIPTEPTPEAHFATFPKNLVGPCILAGTSEKGCCVECGAPWVRDLEKKEYGEKCIDRESRLTVGMTRNKMGGQQFYNNEYEAPKTIGWKPGCDCLSDDGYGITYQNPGGEGRMTFDTEPCTVMDPFLGSGKTAMVAMKHGRKFLGIELSLEYLDEIAIPKITKERKQRKMF